MESNEKRVKDEDARSVNLGRHESQCSICSHPWCQEIEDEWINWQDATKIAQRFDVSRDPIYRHAHALNLFIKRQRNISMALELISRDWIMLT